MLSTTNLTLSLYFSFLKLLGNTVCFFFPPSFIRDKKKGKIKVERKLSNKKIKKKKKFLWVVGGKGGQGACN